jgi:hypothetical protein
MRTAWASSLKPLGACLLAVMLCAGLALPAHAITSNTRFTSAVPVTKETAYRGVFEGGAEAHTGLFCEANPVNGTDPTGHAMSWESYMGYAAEEAIQDEYRQTHLGDAVEYGTWQYGSASAYLKPDIFNKRQQRFLEITDISAAGVVRGPAKILKDYALFRRSGYKPDTSWQPRSRLLITADEEMIYVINIGGVLYYKNIDELKWQLITVGSIKAASDLLPYLQMTWANVGPLILKFGRMAVGVEAAETEDMEVGIGISTLNSIL